MTKLHLVSFHFTTGSNDFSDYRLMAVKVSEQDTEEQQSDKAIALFQQWFPTQHPESALSYFQVRDTIVDNSGKPDNIKSPKKAIHFEGVIDTIDDMATRSLDPDGMEKWDEVKKQLLNIYKGR